jgi:hypothetical protein
MLVHFGITPKRTKNSRTFKELFAPLGFAKPRIKFGSMLLSSSKNAIPPT